MENLIILVDANSIGYAAQHAIKLYSGSMQTQAVFSFIKTMRELRQRYPHAGMVVLWDGRAEWRFEREPSYKSNRKSDPRMQQEHDAYKAQCPFIKRALKALGIKQMTSAIHEADDLAGILVQRFASDPNNRILLITGDRDWLQLVKPNVSWRDLVMKAVSFIGLIFMRKQASNHLWHFFKAKHYKAILRTASAVLGELVKRPQSRFLLNTVQ